jgi:GPH family glycoside/pentoside/hexuronide:cation symporter
MLGWAVGSHGTQAMIGIYTMYLLYFLTGVLGIEALVAGQIIFVVRIYDLITDPVMGHISDRTTSKIGRRRPYLLVGAVGCALSVVLLFNLAEFDYHSSKIITVTAVLFFYATTYTIFNVPHLAMPAEMTSSYNERTKLMSFRIIFFATASFVTLIGGSLLLQNFGEERGFPLLGWLVGSTLLVSMSMSYFMTDTVKFNKRSENVAFSVSQQIKIIGSNRPFLILMLAKLGLLTAQASQVAAFIFFSQYVLQRGPELLMSLGIFMTIGPVLSAPFWVWLSKRLGKRNSFMIAAIFYALVTATWLVSGPTESALIINLRVLCVSLATGGVTLLGLSMLPDTIEYDRHLSGLSREGVYSGIYSTMEKATSAFGPLIFTAFLAANGFVSSRADETVVQNEGTLTSIYVAVGLIPAIAAIFAAIVLIFYNLDREQLEAMTQSRDAQSHEMGKT